MHFKKVAALFAGIVMIGGFAFAQSPQEAKPILFQDFENGIGKWNGIGGEAKVSATTEPENVKSGKGALRFEYTVQAGQFEALLNPFAATDFAALKSIRFWIQSSHDTTFLLALQEKGGGRFATVFSTGKDKWQAVEVDLADLLLQDGADDPKDANGKLDLEKIEFMGLIDFDQVFLQMLGNAPGPASQMIQIAHGPRTLYLDDVTLSSQSLPQSAATPDAADIDLFQRPQAEWAAVGGATLERLQAKDAKDNALRVTYQKQPGRLMALLKPIKRGALAGKKQLSFQAASMQPTTLLLQLEETSGGKYNATIQVPGNATPTPLKINFANFKASPDSNDTNDSLDLDQVKQLLIVDFSGFMDNRPPDLPPEMLDMPGGDPANENTLWLNAVRAK